MFEMHRPQWIWSPLARLVLFTVCLAIAGTILAGAHYFVVDLPHQNAVAAPKNGVGPIGSCDLDISRLCYHLCYYNAECARQCGLEYGCMISSFVE